ncbi:tetratricopeptide repeat protein [Thalassotalea litorea]|uniref:tetratricopeptide repeat protein n=1 Tax=Thalassotalea litorea TaxID=2020715 RepID=UPI003735ED0D
MPKIIRYQFNLMTLAVFFLILGGCSSAPNIDSQPTPLSILLHSDTFPGHKHVKLIDESEIFALSDDMKAFAHGHLLWIEEPKIRAEALLRKLFNRTPSGLVYAQGANLTAQQTFSEQSANCLSLTILAYALAHEVNLSVNFQEVKIPEYWVRDGDYNLLSRHVNLVVTGDRKTQYQRLWGGQLTTIDFDPLVVKKHFDKEVISKRRVTAMFYNNIGANALTSGNYDEAYANFKKSIEVDKGFSAVWGNLGYLYKAHGLISLAKGSYLKAIEQDSDNYNAWTNLGILLKEQGQTKEAEQIAQFIERVRVKNPYYHAVLGDEAYHNGHYQQAIKHFEKASDMQPREHEFYFGLAKSYFKLGDYDRSEKYMSMAKGQANFPDIERKYAQKLKLLSTL